MGTHPIFESDFDCLTVYSTTRMRIDIDKRFSTEDAIYLVQRLADAVKGTAVIISHGWVVDGLVVTEYGQPPIRCLPRERELTIIVLEPGDEIKTFNGENVNFENAVCCGKIEIETINGVKYGPFGHSGDPGRPTKNNIVSSFKTTPGRLYLEVSRFGNYLGPI